MAPGVAAGAPGASKIMLQATPKQATRNRRQTLDQARAAPR